jgi:hypothetical protein
MVVGEKEGRKEQCAPAEVQILAIQPIVSLLTELVQLNMKGTLHRTNRCVIYSKMQHTKIVVSSTNG